MDEPGQKINTQPMVDALQGLIEAFRGIQITPGLFQWINTQRERRCQLCAKQYTPDSPLGREPFDDRPPRCPDCMKVINRVALEARAILGEQVTTDTIVGFAARRITYQPFQYGRPWQDHVPTNKRHIIKETP